MTDPFSQCQVLAYRNGAELLIVLRGWVRMANCEETKRRIIDLMLPPIERVYLNLSGVQEIDSAGLGMIVGLHMTSRKNHMDLALLPLNPNLKKLLDTTRLISILKVINIEEGRAVLTRLEADEWAVPSDVPPACT